MPVLFSEMTTPKGRQYLRVEASGVVDEEEAAAAVTKLHASPLPMLLFLKDDTKITTAARKRMAKISEQRTNPQTLVAPNPLVRAMISFLVKALSIGKPNANLPTILASEAEALTWLDAQVDARAA